METEARPKGFGICTNSVLSAFAAIVGEAHVLQGPESERYNHDETEDLHFSPEAVLRPASTAEVAGIVKICAAHRLPITARGAGTGLSGGALPVHGGVILSLERMNAIVSIDQALMQATVQAGVVNDALQMALEPFGLFYPPDPASKGSCTLGGNIAHSSGGPRALKYGGTKDYVLNLHVVLANGETLWTGANTLKNSSGYNLTQLLVGSEGTLGIVTEAVMRVLPAPKLRLMLAADYASPALATQTVQAVIASGAAPSAVEYMDATAFHFSASHLGLHDALPPSCQARLLVELDGFELHDIQSRALLAAHALQAHALDEVAYAEAAHQQEALWRIRRHIAHAVRATSIYKEEDVCVPRTRLPDVLACVRDLEGRYGFRAICYGHAGDGNVHINILKDSLPEDAWQRIADEAIPELFAETYRLGGVVSGEHGIGYVQKHFLKQQADPALLQAMRQIKFALDPLGILNPGKLFADD